MSIVDGMALSKGLTRSLFGRIRDRYAAPEPVIAEPVAEVPLPGTEIRPDVNEFLYDFVEFSDGFRDQFNSPEVWDYESERRPDELARAVIKSPSFDNPKIERREMRSGAGWEHNPSVSYLVTVVPHNDGALMSLKRVGARYDESDWEREFEFIKDGDGYFPSSDLKDFLTEAEALLKEKYVVMSAPGSERNLDGILPPEPDDSRDYDYDDDSLHGLVYGAQG